MEGRSRGVYSAGHIRRIIHAALFSALICFPVTDERKSRMPLAIMAMGDTFQRNQCDLVGCQLFQLCIAGKVRTGHILDKSFTFGRSRDLFHRYGHQSACGPCNPEFTEAGRYASLPAGERFLSLCDFCQLFRGTGGMDRICLADGFTCGWVFAWWTAANLVPRADAIYKRYCEEFGKQTVGSRKRIIPYIY